MTFYSKLPKKCNLQSQGCRKGQTVKPISTRGADTPTTAVQLIHTVIFGHNIYIFKRFTLLILGLRIVEGGLKFLAYQ